MNNEKKAPVLTLEHLAPYLPYGLKVLHTTKDESTQLIVMGLHDDGGRTRYESEGTDSDPNFSIAVCRKAHHKYRPNGYFYLQKNFKPILRPLSDLSSYNERFEESWISRLNKECIEFSNADGIWLDSDLDFDLMYDRCEQPAYLSLEYASKCRDWLIKNHFDLFGLIEKGLAVDINSIEGKETNS